MVVGGSVLWWYVVLVVVIGGDRWWYNGDFVFRYCLKMCSVCCGPDIDVVSVSMRFSELFVYMNILKKYRFVFIVRTFLRMCSGVGSNKSTNGN